MADRTPTAAGGIIALTTLAGGIAGILLGQPSAGLLAGLGTGAAVGVALWLAERWRGR